MEDLVGCEELACLGRRFFPDPGWRRWPSSRRSLPAPWCGPHPQDSRVPPSPARDFSQTSGTIPPHPPQLRKNGRKGNVNAWFLCCPLGHGFLHATGENVCWIRSPGISFFSSIKSPGSSGQARVLGDLPVFRQRVWRAVVECFTLSLHC